MSTESSDNNNKNNDTLERQLRQVLPDTIELARQAGQIILSIYKTDFKICNKKDNTPVTTADFAANDHIVQSLAQLTPHIPILSEESETIPYAQRQEWETYWLVDPLDGTRAFIDKTGEFSVNIALIHQHQPVIGVIYSPIKQCCFYACKGNGAFYLDENDQARAITVCNNYSVDKSKKLIIAGTQSARSPALQDYFDNVAKLFDGYELIYMGSSLKSCMVAEGIADLYVRLGPTSEWDTAAAQCIVEEAGGLITDLHMHKLRYNTKESLLNPDFFVFGNQNICWSRFLGK